MTEKTNYGLLVTILITLLGWGVTFGTCKNKIDTNARDIQRLETQLKENVQQINERQDNSEKLLNEINKNLIELNTKMTLLLKGNLKTEK